MSERHFETMSSFIPDFDRVKTAYVADATDETKYAVAEEDMPLPEEAGAEFDRFIAKAKADALREARAEVRASDFWTNGEDNLADRVRGWLTIHADRIEGEA